MNKVALGFLSPQRWDVLHPHLRQLTVKVRLISPVKLLILLAES